MSNPIAGIYVGHTSESMAGVRDAILAVLATSAGDAVKIAAIEAVAKLCKVESVQVSNCSVTMAAPRRTPKRRT